MFKFYPKGQTDIVSIDSSLIMLPMNEYLIFCLFFSFSDLKSLFLTLYLYPLPSPPSVAPGSGAVAAYSRLTGIFTETRLHRLTVQSGTCCYVTMSLFFLSPLPPDSYHTEAVTPPAHYPLTYYPTACNE